MSQINEKRYAPILKKNIGHIKLTASCTAYTVNADILLFSLASELYIKNDDIPIRAKRTVQTTGNNHAGGDPSGFIIAPYISPAKLHRMPFLWQAVSKALL